MLFLDLVDTYLWKYRTSNLTLMLGFQHKCTDRSKPYIKIKMMRPYHSVQMSTQRQIWLWCVCWQQAVPNRYIKVEFDIGYFQWHMPMIFLVTSIRTWFGLWTPLLPFQHSKECGALFYRWNYFIASYRNAPTWSRITGITDFLITPSVWIYKKNYWTWSIPVGTPTSPNPPGLTRHQALAMVIKSPQGFSMSPYLRKNEKKIKAGS